jgi:hypothetical protein
MRSPKPVLESGQGDGALLHFDDSKSSIVAPRIVKNAQAPATHAMTVSTQKSIELPTVAVTFHANLFRHPFPCDGRRATINLQHGPDANYLFLVGDFARSW